MATLEETLKLTIAIGGAEDAKKLQNAIDALEKSFADAGPEAKGFIDEIKQLADKSQQLQKALSLKAGLSETTTQLASAKAGLAALNAQFDRTDTSSKKVTKAFADAEKAVASLAAQQNAQSIALQKTEGGLQKAGVDTTNLAAANIKLQAEGSAAAVALGKIGAAAVTASSGTSRLASGAEKVKESFVHVTEGVGEFVKKAAEITGIAGIISSVVAAFSGFKLFEVAVEEATHFDQALGKLRATSSATTEEFAALKEKIEATATALDLTATEGAVAASKLAAAFGDANKAAAALPATLELSKAAQIDVATAADIVARAVKGFGIEAADAGVVADTLATIAIKTGQDLSGLSGTLAQLAPFAKAVGLSFQDTAAILGVLAQKGIDSEGALGGLRGLFEGLRNPTSTLRQELAGLGVDTSSFQTIIEGLAKAGPKAEGALDSLGTKGKAAILALVQDGGIGLAAFQAKLGDTAGAAKKAGDAIENNLLDAFKDFGNNLSNLAGSLLGGALDPIKEEVQRLTAQIKGIPESAGFQAIKQAITDFATSAVASFESLIKSINFEDVSASVTKFVKGASDGFSSLTDGVKQFADGATVAANTVGAIFHALEAAIFGVASVIAKAIEITGKGALVLSGQIAALNDPTNELVRGLDAFGASAQVNFDRAATAGGQAVDNFNAITGAVDAAGASAADASGKIAGAGDAAAKAGAAAEGAAAKSEPFIEKLDEISSAAKNAAANLALDAYLQAAANLDRLAQSSTTTATQLDAAQVALFNATRQLLALSPAAQQAAASTDNLQGAFAKLGVESQASLALAAEKAKNAFDAIDKGSAQTAAGLADRKAAFLAYAQAALAAANSLNDGTKDQVAAQLEAKASALGLSDELSKLEGVGVDSGTKIAASYRGAATGIASAAQAAHGLATSYEEATQSIEAASAATDAQRGSLAAIQLDLSAYSAKAKQTFADVQTAAFRFGVQNDADVNALIANLNEGNRAIEASIKRGQASVEQFVTNYSTLTDAQLANLARQSGGFEGLQRSIESTATAARAGAGDFALLNDADLSRLESAADAVAQRIQAISDKALAAKTQLEDLASSLQDQIDQINGDQGSQEERRFQKQLKDIKDQAEANNLLNSAAYRDAIAKAQQLHDLKLKQIADEAAARDKSNQPPPSKPGGVGGGGSGGGTGGGGTPPAAPPPNQPASGRPSTSAPINININAQPLDAKGLDDLSRKLKKIFNDIDGRSR